MKNKNLEKLKTKKYKLDIFLMIAFPILATVLTIVCETNFLESILLFFVLPSVYLSFRRPALVLKSLIFTTIFSLPLGIMIDYLAIMDNSWFVPFTVFDVRFMGVIPIEDFIWVYFWVYFIIMFYEYFLDHGKRSDRISSKFKYLIALLTSVSIVFASCFFVAPDLLSIEYFYLKGGIIVAIIPLIIIFFLNSNLFIKYIKIGTYFAIMSLMFELVGLHNDQWVFTGNNFIGFIEFLGHRFPLEEFTFWILLGSIWVLSYYEIFADDTK